MPQDLSAESDSPGEVPPLAVRRGHSPLIVSMPHVGVRVPQAILERLTPVAAGLADTDWHLPLVYDFLEDLDATVLVATHSRLVIDLNRPPDDANLYPGQDTTGLVPVDTFRREPLYAGALPDAAEVASRLRRYWLPYHDALAMEIARLRDSHERIVVWDAHSIASALPRFFQGRLTDLNFGTANGASCAPGLIESILVPVRAQQRYSWVLNGRFTGGYITRRYGEPARGVHAVQLEMSQITYMDEVAPFELQPARCAQLQPLLASCLRQALGWAKS